MLRLQSLANVYKRRTLRAVYGQTQAYPYAMTLSAAFDRTANQISISGSKAAINPGSVAQKLAGEVVTLYGSTEAVAGAGGTATATTSITHPFGLFANFVGGQLDELFTRSEVGVWKGTNSVFELLAPAFTDTGTSAAGLADVGDTLGHQAWMVPDSTGRLVYDSSCAGPWTASHLGVARLISYLSANAILVELYV